MGKISALIWIIWVGSDTQWDTDFWVRFYVTVFPTSSKETLQILDCNIKGKHI